MFQPSSWIYTCLACFGVLCVLAIFLIAAGKWFKEWWFQERGSLD